MNIKHEAEIVLQLEGVTRDYSGVPVLQEVSLSIARGEFVALVGPSGCGKTTLLNLMSGFDAPSAGRVTREGATRTVFQRDGLFPWLSVAQNIELGAREMPDDSERAERVREMLGLIRLDDSGALFPHQLSGGMRQKVELARALAGDAPILLMDEPFSALDYLSRLQMRAELARLLRERPRTVVFVTHDVPEAAQLADRIALLDGRPGRLKTVLSMESPRPRDPSQPDVVSAVHCALETLGFSP